MASKVIESGMRIMSKKLFAEFLGTFALVFLGAGAIVSGKEDLRTALLVAVIFGVAVDKRSVAASHPGLPIGLTISAVILSVGPITGAALNPARWFGPALVSGDWTNAWVYIVAPISAAIISVGPITGAALNPARWFGPALVSGDWTNAWVYIVAPIAGALIAGFAYQAVAKPE